MKKTFITTFLLISIVSLFFFSCEKSDSVDTLKTEKLFSLKYGSYEDELHLYTNNPNDFLSSICMNDGFFYVADSASQKVMQFNSYGDLLSVYYNSDSNPVPSFIQLSNIEVADVGVPSVAATKRATVYPFLKTTNIAVDKRKYLYVVDYLPEERYETDSENGQLLRQVVLRFSSDGTFIDYLGQQGLGGIPFPTIKKIYTTQNNELVTLCISSGKYTVYWFSEDGFLKYNIPIYLDRLPIPNKNEDEEWFVALDSIIPDFNEQKLYLKIDYSKTVYDSSSKVQSGINYEQTLLYPFNLETSQYEEPLTIPSFEQTVVSEFSKEVYLIPYDFLGVTNSGWFVFILPDSTGYAVMLLQPDGSKIIKRHLDIEYNNLVYYNLTLADDGIICAMLSTPETTNFVWWRTDEIIESLLLR